MPRWSTMLVVAITLGGVVQASFAQASVRMRPTVLVADGASIVLRDVATVDGATAEALRELVVWSSTSGTPRPTSMTPEDVRKFLDANGQNMGRITVSGGTAAIMLGTADIAPTPTPTTPAAPSADASSTLRGVVPMTIAAHVGAGIDDLKLEFDDDDAALLATSITGRTYTIAPVGRSDRQPLHLRVYEGDTLVVAKTIKVGVLLRRQVGVAVADIERETVLTPALIASEERWLPPSTRVVPAEEVVGRIAKSRIDAGKAVESRQLAEQFVVRKGETVVVDCISGGVVVRAQMRARSDAKVGDVIEFAPLASEVTGREKLTKRVTGKPTFIAARVAGPGKAVMVVAGNESEERRQ